jgi:uncharacterized protein DUF3500
VREIAASMAGAAARYLESLDPPQRERVRSRFDDEDRFVWFYWPSERRGLPLADMDEPQRASARTLLATGLSPDGLATAEQIIALEVILGDLERETDTMFFPRDPEQYFFSVFGEPGAPPWGWRAEGHHLSVHFTIVSDAEVAVTPSFFGSNPADVPHGPHKGLRVLAPLEDIGRELVTSLDDRRRAVALIAGEAPPDILTRNLPRIDPLTPAGLIASEMTQAQRGMLRSLVHAHIGRAQEAFGDEVLSALNGAQFAWAGSIEKGKAHYYRIQAEGFVIEYDNFQNDANHIHAVWRDPTGDFGTDLLQAHRKAAH